MFVSIAAVCGCGAQASTIWWPAKVAELAVTSYLLADFVAAWYDRQMALAAQRAAARAEAASPWG